MKLSTFAILNTNGDDTVLTNAIPANTNSVKSIDFLASELKEVLTNVKVVKKAPVKKIDTNNAPKTVKKSDESKEEKASEKAPEKKETAKKETTKKTTTKKEETTQEK